MDSSIKDAVQEYTSRPFLPSFVIFIFKTLVHLVGLPFLPKRGNKLKINAPHVTMNILFITDILSPFLKKKRKCLSRYVVFDIEASSSHGDFPLPKKSYKKLVMDILDYWDREDIDDEQETQQNILRKIILTAFGMDDIPGIHRLHLKGATPSYKKMNDKIDRWLSEPVRQQSDGVHIGESVKRIDEDEEYNHKWWKSKPKVKDTILDVLNNKKFDRGDKLEEIDKTFIQGFPTIKGDKVTFIGSTFMLLGEQETYMNHCIALDTCDDIPDATIESLFNGTRSAISMDKYYSTRKSRYYYRIQYFWF